MISMFESEHCLSPIDREPEVCVYRPPLFHTSTAHWGLGGFPIVWGWVSYRICILLYLDVSCVYGYMYILHPSPSRPPPLRTGVPTGVSSVCGLCARCADVYSYRALVLV